MQDLAIIILAAGAGTRMRSNTPKVAHTISGEAMIIQVLKQAFKLTNDVSVVLYHQKELVQKLIQEKFENVKIFIQDLPNYPGTAGALKGIKTSAKKTIITCADMPLITQNELQKLYHTQADIAVASFVADDPSGYGRIVLDKNEQIQKIVEQKDASQEELQIKLVNGGCYCFNSEVLQKIIPQIDNKNAQNEYYLTDAVQIARQMGLSIKAIKLSQEALMGVNDKFQLAKAEEIMQEKIRQNLMKQGVIMHLPSTIYIDSRAVIEGECEIESGVVIKGECKIKDSTILANSVIESSTIQHSTIGPMARVRPKSVINGSKIGNFVEIKASVLKDVKAGHLSYLGDCEIGSGTNIGCGSITCNYDGKQKHKTKIGENVFIGSNSNLIAPLNIASDVFIAAGSSISEDIDSGELVIERAKLKRIQGGYYKFMDEKDAKK